MLLISGMAVSNVGVVLVVAVGVCDDWTKSLQCRVRVGLVMFSLLLHKGAIYGPLRQSSVLISE